MTREAAAADDPLEQLLQRLAHRGIRRGRLTATEHRTIRQLLDQHGPDALLAEATRGHQPDVVRGALTRWADLRTDISHLRPVVRCEEHQINHTGTCPSCRADQLAKGTA